MRHFNLYKYVFTQKRTPTIIKTEVEVDPPAEPLPMSESKNYAVWDYERKYHEVEEKEELTKNEKSKKKDAFQHENQEKIETSYDTIESAQPPLEKEVTISTCILT